jgi:putative heme-binding domain-containing protein
MKLSFVLLPLLIVGIPIETSAQTLDASLRLEDAQALVSAAASVGNPVRGAIHFHGPFLGCAKCHSVSEVGEESMGPRLVGEWSAEYKDLIAPERMANYLVESLLQPSAHVPTKYRALQLVTADGNVVVGIPVAEAPAGVVRLKDVQTLVESDYSQEEIVQQQTTNQSIMPAGLVNSLANRSEFLDLVSYLLEIRRGGERRARELQPTAAQLAIALPEYEARIDHAGMVASWNEKSRARGEQVYMSLCVNCHGTHETPGSLATALRFGEGKFKFGNDPYSMYQTLTRGAGLMLPQPWLVPQQKYDVIHYLREEYLKERNPSQHFAIDENYLQSLPTGDERGPAPRKIEPWSQADYGPRLAGTYEIGAGAANIAYKGIAIQLDSTAGGVAHGEAWVVFDHDTLRIAGVWSNGQFIDWQGINFNGRHGIHPHIAGNILLANPIGPGWSHPESHSWHDDARVQGRDGKPYGPLPREWGKYTGVRQDGARSTIDYLIGSTKVQEQFAWIPQSTVDSDFASGYFGRRLQMGGRHGMLEVLVASLPEDQVWEIKQDVAYSIAAADASQTAELPGSFQGTHYYQIEKTDGLELRGKDFTLRALLTAAGDGTIFSFAPRNGGWAPGGQALFIRGGKLCYDVGWVGVIQSNVSINDGKQHAVALTWEQEKGLASLWVDNNRVAKKKLQPAETLQDGVLRIGYTSDDFPIPSTLQSARLERVQLLSRALDEQSIADFAEQQAMAASWEFVDSAASMVPDATGNGHDATRIASIDGQATQVLTTFRTDLTTLEWRTDGGRLSLRIPAGDEEAIVDIWTSGLSAQRNLTPQEASRTVVTAGEGAWGGNRPAASAAVPFPQTIYTSVNLGQAAHGFAVDTLEIPSVNPWRALVRVTGVDFLSNPSRMAVCTWDGDVWLVTGRTSNIAESQEVPLAEATYLGWQRIAFGLFQPLGLKIVNDIIYLTCRDQLVRLDDLNGDDYIDYYHCVNNDHQVTEHFHEFAMGLQVDTDGNFYYAKSARHALPALVPHHGTLLRVSSNGARTDILANGFRAANGVCLNADGSFIVTDQEGHWNPKNRINWVREGGFYGNMFGYHSVVDDSDSAMEQPLCWITNRFDRSPAELLWVDSPSWGPLNGSLLNLSYGYGKIYIVPIEKKSSELQGGMCQLPFPELPTGIIRGRFSPHDQQLYVCGLAAWGTNQMMNNGGLYRVRKEAGPSALPIKITTSIGRLRIEFSEPLGEATSLDPAHYSVEAWDLKRSANYGSDHFNQRRLPIDRVELSSDRRALELHIADLAPTRGMEIRLPVVDQSGKAVERVIHNSIHALE